MPLHHFPARVRYLRELTGLTQEELAHRAELSLATVSRIERGTTDPKLSQLDALAQALDVPTYELF